ncbi:putative Ubiquitin conjugating enzyme [Trypanosoma vivax]|uniref:Putative ubiquitin-protein ligase n=1 Tax=Trypanosoma vivax (strain Y486) TaxID=1055687 RepID=G0U038_TRYVY|nr:putative ubiquitin-protein ligase [Trypanosoma vivax]KAH8613612.1 putative Ubiquitin conjugating enzyme [Trypanosoma vivax]CCC49435.1 putative ubiquitin-protein ligase [Trypanosoma vivax Y486]
MCSITRLGKELRDINEHPDPYVSLRPSDPNNMFVWEAVLKGPSETPFEGGKYRLCLSVPRDYPMVPPKANFVTKVFHPNVDFETGAVCLDILKSRWSPAWTLVNVCRAVLCLFSDPDPTSPFNCDAGNLLRAGDITGYNSMVRMYAITEAGAPPFTDDE